MSIWQGYYDPGFGSEPRPRKFCDKTSLNFLFTQESPELYVLDLEGVEKMTGPIEAALHVLKVVTADSHEPVETETLKDALGASQDQHVFEYALAHLNRAERLGTDAQRRRLQERSHEISILNRWMAKEPERLSERLTERLGLSSVKVDALRGRELSLPNGPGQTILSTLTAFLRIPYCAVAELLSAPLAGALSVFWRSDLDAKRPVLDPCYPPVLFLHGLKHNQSGWLLGQGLLRLKESLGSGRRFGSFYSMSYSKLFSNEYDMGIDDYVGRVVEKIKNIRNETGHKEVILVGHSLGGLIASRCAVGHPQLGVRHVFTLASPFRGSPIADSISTLKKAVSLRRRQIDEQLCTRVALLKQIEKEAREADLRGRVRHHCIASTTDQLVPWRGALITEDNRRRLVVSWLGHLSLMFSPFVWHWIDRQLVDIYKEREQELSSEGSQSFIEGSQVTKRFHYC